MQGQHTQVQVYSQLHKTHTHEHLHTPKHPNTQSPKHPNTHTPTHALTCGETNLSGHARAARGLQLRGPDPLFGSGSPEMRGWRNAVGDLIEPLWLNKNLSRTATYRYMREKKRVRFHRIRDFQQYLLFQQYAANLSREPPRGGDPAVCQLQRPAVEDLAPRRAWARGTDLLAFYVRGRFRENRHGLFRSLCVGIFSILC